MSKSKISYLNISPYSRHSPSLQLKTGLKKQSNSVERPKSGKAYYAGIEILFYLFLTLPGSTTRGHTPINNPEIIDRKYSPFGDGKGDMGDSLRQFYKTKTTKEKPGSAKPSKTRDAQVKKPLKSSVRPLDNRNEKLGIYHYVNSKSTKNLEDVRSHNPSMHITPSRQGSRNNLHDEKDISHERRIPEAGIFQHKQLIEALEEMRRSKGKLTNSNVQNQSHSSLVNRASQKPPQSSYSGSGKVVQYSSVSLAKPKKEYEQPSRRPSEQQIKNNIFKDLKLASKKASEVLQQQQPKEEIIAKQQDAHAAQKKHRRGLSSGQNPLFLEQQLAMEQLAMERERMKQMQLLQQQQLQQQQQQLLLQQQQQQMQQMQQMQLHMQNQYKDPQQEEDEFYEEFFHMDKMTFGFEKLMISQKEVIQNNSSTTPVASPSNGKNPSVQSQQSGHHRTRSTGIEEQISMMPTTKSSSRWNTKKSSIDHHDQRGQGQERFNMLEHISEFDKSEIEKETMRRYYKQQR